MWDDNLNLNLLYYIGCHAALFSRLLLSPLPAPSRDTAACIQFVLFVLWGAWRGRGVLARATCFRSITASGHFGSAMTFWLA